MPSDAHDAPALTVTHVTQPDGRPVTRFDLELTDMPAMTGLVSLSVYPDGTRIAHLAMTTTFFMFSDLERVQLLLDRMAAEARRLESEE